MNTRVSSLLGTKYPIIQAPMAYIVGEELAAAVSNAGCFGMISTSDKSPEGFVEACKKMRSLTDKPWGTSLVVFVPRYKEFLELIIKEKVPIVLTTLGSPKSTMDYLKSHGIKVVTVVGSVRQAIKAERDGADAVIAEGYGGGGGIGYVDNLVLTPRVLDKVKIPVLSAGGIVDGRGFAAALAMGAEGIYMGSRFAATKESLLPEKMRQRWVEANEEDMLVTDKVIGLQTRILKNKLARRLMKGSAYLVAWRFIPTIRNMKQLYGASNKEMLQSAFGFKQVYKVNAARYSILVQTLADGIKKDDPENCIFPIGQGIANVSSCPPVNEVIEKLIADTQKCLETAKTRI